MPLTDVLVLLLVFAGTAASAAMLRRQSFRGRSLFVGVWLSFYGLVLTAMMLAHSVEILYRTVASGVQGGAATRAYDFRLYSLLLLGALLIWAGVECLRAAPGLSRGSRSARRTALRATLAVLAIVVPLIPLQLVFGTLLTALSILSLAVLTWAARTTAHARHGVRPSAPRPTVSA